MTAALSGTVAPQHLSPDAISTYRADFERHPARMLVIRDFLIPSVAERLSQFVANEAEYGTEAHVYPQGAGMVGQPFYQFQKGRVPKGRLTAAVGQGVAFMKLLEGPLIRFFAAVTGTALGRVDLPQARKMVNGDFVRPHSDRGRGRRLAWILHLTPKWEAQWGGEMYLVPFHGDRTCIPPLYNALVLFDVLGHKNHWVEPISGDGHRLTFCGWALADPVDSAESGDGV